MCRTVSSVLHGIICSVQMLVRMFMTTMLMIENIFRMVLQTTYNFISFMMQMISLLPLVVIFLVASRVKCFMCGGGGGCPVQRTGVCDCFMSVVAIVILFFVFRATGVLDKIFYNLGYIKSQVKVTKFIATTGEITECSRNDTDTEYVFYGIETTATEMFRAYFGKYDSTTEEFYEINDGNNNKDVNTNTDDDGSTLAAARIVATTVMYLIDD